MSSVSGDDETTKDPQTTLNEFWDNLITKKPGKVTNIFPPSLYANLLPPQHKPGPAKGKNAAESYQAAADECRARVKRIVRECHRVNEKFTDPDFDIDGDFGINNCLKGLMSSYYDREGGGDSVSSGRLSSALTTLAESNVLGTPMVAVDVTAVARILNDDDDDDDDSAGIPACVHRIDWIYDKPSFVIDGFSSSDVQQGGNGDCWFIAALATLCSNPQLMENICVERDEECGVYGFVFQRDGEWISTVIDDNLYLRVKDFDAYIDQYDPSGEKERKWKKNNQTGSDALYFASCADQNETWLPLLEKAYAKVHGDYQSISGGISGEAVEDMTGGVTTKVLTNRILSKERLWKELLEVNKQFLFSASSPGGLGGDTHSRRGLALNHVYSIIKAVEEEDEEGKPYRLVLIRNPWGKRSWQGMGEWNGPWSDGSKEWTPYWLKKLNHRFGDDGLFWMSYEDLQKRFELLDRTRLFDKDWTVVQDWTSVSVSWVTGYLNTKFLVEIKTEGPTVFVLSQLDDRYFRGLEGKYRFDLHFLLQEEGAAAGEHIVRARGAWFGNRSISAEVDLTPGKYEIVPKIVASRYSDAPEVYEVVTKLADKNPQKLRQIGMNYDIANAKGVVELTEEEKKKKEEKEKAAKEKKKKEKEEAEKEKAEFEEWKKEKREREEKEKAEKGKAEKAKKEKKGKKDEKGGDKEEAKTEVAEKKEDRKEEKKEEVEESEESEEEEEESEESESDADSDDTTDEKDKETKTGPKKDSKKSSSKPKKVEKGATKDADGSSNSEEEDGEDTPVSGDEAGPSGPDAHTYGAGTEADVDADAAPQPAANPPADENKQNPWNAVCVMGLRVYSKDPEVSIKLIKPKDAEEGAVLDADGATQAGATM
ncbi:cysteine proteinase [Zopfia rhizophila CBS 207.26]|uniref:Cysteine proteinase n=1 Tax=Zopfia rhizophila CBS 207.26 TaxID=1314779 RepID=A0A6A6ERU9_9PEZI|nr:cysteine proteinase [Zopfia rhizophila CBS 207.26]